MSKIEELIEKLCPNGVKKDKIKNICNVTIGEFVHKNKQRDNAPYPVFNGGINNTGFYDEYNNDGKMILVSARGANAGFVNKIEGKYWAGNSCYSLDVRDKENNNWMFVYYSIKNNEKKLLGEQQRGSIPAISKKQIEEFEIAVPPLEVQCEIVHILDDFTLLSAELSAELKARQKQYEYYKETLLEKNLSDKVRLGDCLLKVENIKWKQTNDIHLYIDLSSVDRERHRIINTTEINKSNAPSRAQQIVKTNDVLFGGTRPMLKRSCLIEKQYNNEICSTGFCVLRANTDKILPKWIYFMISTNSFYNYVEQNQKGASYPAITDGAIKDYKISLPSLKEQEKIIELLDKFEKYNNDMFEGLPAEIEARQKQYEYYRDKLLTFKKIEVKI